MTYKIKNVTIVFAFAALLMVMPLAGSNVYADQEAIVGASCGFDEQNPPSFGAITRGATVDSISEVTATFTPASGATGTGTIFVEASDWVGAGSRSSTVLTVVADVESGDTVNVGALTYTATAGDQSGSNSAFSFDGGETAIEIAAEIALDINARDPLFRAFTNGGNTVTVEVEARGSAGDGETTTYVTGGSATSAFAAGTTSSGGTGSTTSHLPAENTKFDISAAATTTPGDSTGTLYASKIAMPVDGGIALEMVSGTSNSENVEISFSIDTSFITAATQTITLLDVAAGDTVTVRGLIYVATDGVSTTAQTFDVTTSDDTADALTLLTAINTADGTLLTASQTGAVVTVTADNAGSAANAYTLQETGTTITLGAATFTGGTENLENFPFDGTLTQTLTFTIDCTGV